MVSNKYIIDYVSNISSLLDPAGKYINRITNFPSIIRFRNLHFMRIAGKYPAIYIYVIINLKTVFYYVCASFVF